MRFDETADGAEVELLPGEEFEIALGEVRTAGYRWTVKSGAEAACTLLEESSQRSPGAAGGSGTRTWKLRAPSSGNCAVELVYQRSWEEHKPARTFTLKVRVRPAPR